MIKNMGEYELFFKSQIFIWPKSLYQNILKDNMDSFIDIEKIVDKPYLVYNFLPENFRLEKDLKKYILSIPVDLLENMLSFSEYMGKKFTKKDIQELESAIKIKKVLIDLLEKNIFLEESNMEYIETILEKSDINDYRKYLKHFYLYTCGYVVGNFVEEDRDRKNIILYGPPGTGKTYSAIFKALQLVDKNIFNKDTFSKKEMMNIFKEYQNKGQIEFCTFHQSFGYEEFVEGLRSDKKGGFIPKDGIFKIISKAALNRKENYVLIIDEINRGNISKIFGEIITLIETDKRIGAKHPLRVKLPYSGEKFGVPKNLYIIGTMNSSDKSLVNLDIALRRRFDFQELPPDENLLMDIGEINLKKLLKSINDRIEFFYDKDYKIGHGYFINIFDLEGLVKIFRENILPLLEECFYGDYMKIGMVLGGIGESENDNYIIYKEIISPENIFKNTLEMEEVSSKVIYRIKKDFSLKEIKNIYE